MPKRSPPRWTDAFAPARGGLTQKLACDCEADVLAGLERFAYAELTERLNERVKIVGAPHDGRLRFDYRGDLRALLDMRSILAIYLVRRFAVPRPRALLGHQHFTALLDLIDSVRAPFPKGAYRTLRLSAAGADSAVLSKLKTELAQHTGLEIAPDEGDLLLRLRRAPDRGEWEVLARISPRPLATRAWRVCNRPGALNATLAHCMMLLSEPDADDVVLNLACGSGTLLVERLALGPARSVVGCDTDIVALDCARLNLQAAGYQGVARLEPWDAGQIPLPDRRVTMICADLPFGQLVGSHRENEELYPRIFAEASRIAVPLARMVLLTHEIRLLERVAVEYARQWRQEEGLRVRVGGMAPRVYVFRRQEEYGLSD
jgi:tRNA (guanine6-N2)-methyltransferase